jgi:hypothetical protein
MAIAVAVMATVGGGDRSSDGETMAMMDVKPAMLLTVYMRSIGRVSRHCYV